MIDKLSTIARGNLRSNIKIAAIIAAIAVAAVNVLRSIHGHTGSAAHGASAAPAGHGAMTGSTPFVTAAVVVGSIAFAVYWRTRRQVVRPWQEMTLAGAIVILSGLTIALAGHLPLLPLVLAPLGLAGGYVVGLRLVPSIQFRRDAATGTLWMQGGFSFMAVWLATIALRYGVRYLATGALLPTNPWASTAGMQPWVAALAIDPLCASAGLWIARAVAVMQRYRANTYRIADHRPAMQA